MSSPVASLSLIVVALVTCAFTLPIIEPETSTSFSVNVAEGHFPRAFTNELEMFTSTIVTPLFEDTTVLPQRLSKKDNGADDQDETKPVEMTTMSHDEGSVDDLPERNVDEEEKNIDELTTMSNDDSIDRQARKFEETNTSEPEVVSTDKLFVKSQTTVEKDYPKEEKSSTSTMIPEFSSSSMSTTTEKFVGHFEDDEEKGKEKFVRKPMKKSKEEKKETESESHEATSEHSSAPLAEFVPNAFDSISTPPGDQLEFDENHQSIPQSSTEKIKEKENEEDQEATEMPKEKLVKTKTIIERVSKSPKVETKLNQGEESAIPEEKKSHH